MSIKKGKAPIAFRLAIALTAVLAISACSSDDDDDAPAIDPDQSAMTDADAMTGADANSVTVLLDAAQEIPAPVGVPAEAMGSAEVSVDDAGVVTATLTVSGLTGPATAAHIHRGFAGETGPVVVGLETSDGGTTWTAQAGAEPLSAEDIEAFNMGGLYFNVHTEANMPGEIRGQINGENAPAQAAGVVVQLDAAQEIPAPVGVPAEAMGSAEVSVDDAGVVTATLTVSGLTGPAVAAHIHMGFPGETGGVIVGLSSDDGGSTWTVAADAEPLTEDQIGAFNRGELYFNVHTEANMPGEIRGQIEPAATMASSETPRLLANVAELDGSKTLLDTRTGLVWANDVQFCSVGDIQAQASNCGVLSDMAVSGITDWRLATSSEMAEITRAVNSDANVSFGYDGGTCAVMTNDNESVIAGVRCVSGNSSQ